MYKIDTFQLNNGTWVYSFSMRNHDHLKDSKRIFYDINFPLVLAIKAIVTKHVTNGYIYGPEFCGKCRKFGSDEDVCVSFCSYCTKKLCIGSLEHFACQCNQNNIAIQDQIDDQKEGLENHGIGAIGCLESNCIFKTYLNNKQEISNSINKDFTSLMTDVLNLTNDYISSPLSLPNSRSTSIINNSPFDESYYISDSESLESDKNIINRLAIIHPNDLDSEPKPYTDPRYDEEIGSSDSTDDLNITSSSEKSKMLAKHLAIYNLNEDEEDLEEIDGEKIVYSPKSRFIDLC